MGYMKNIWIEKQELTLFDEELKQRLKNKKPWGSGGEEEYVKSMSKLRELLEPEYNLTVIRALSEALFKLLDIARKTWHEEWNETTHKHKFKKTDNLTSMIKPVMGCECISLNPLNVRAIDRCECGEERTRPATKAEANKYIRAEGYGYDWP